MAESPSELRVEIEKLERKHAENPEGRYFVPLANAYRKLGAVEHAEALLRDGLRRHAEYLSAHVVLGRCLADRGAHREATAEFRYVLSLDPQNLVALRALGDLALQARRPDEAVHWFQQLLAVDPMNDEARAALVDLDVTVEPPPAPTPSPKPAEPRPAPAREPVDLDVDFEEDVEDVEDVEVESGEPAGGEVLDGSIPDEVVTETIAELYARQGFHARAAAVLREVIRRRGGDPALEARLAELERLAAPPEETAGTGASLDAGPAAGREAREAVDREPAEWLKDEELPEAVDRMRAEAQHEESEREWLGGLSEERAATGREMDGLEPLEGLETEFGGPGMEPREAAGRGAPAGDLEPLEGLELEGAGLEGPELEREPIGPLESLELEGPEQDASGRYPAEVEPLDSLELERTEVDLGPVAPLESLELEQPEVELEAVEPLESLVLDRPDADLGPVRDDVEEPLHALEPFEELESFDSDRPASDLEEVERVDGFVAEEPGEGWMAPPPVEPDPRERERRDDDAFAASFTHGFHADERSGAEEAPRAEPHGVETLFVNEAVNETVKNAASISGYLAELAAWHPGRESRRETAAAGARPTEDEVQAGAGTIDPRGSEPAPPEPEPGEPEAVEPRAVAFPASDPEAGADGGQEATGSGALDDEPWAAAPLHDEPTAEPVTEAAGTAPAADELFPWETAGEPVTPETPGAEPPAESAAAPEAATEQERGVDEEPYLPDWEDELPDPSAAAPPTPPEAALPPPGEPATADVGEDDDDLESFQSWLRSLKR